MSVVSGYLNAKAARRAGDQQAQASAEATAENKRQFDLSRADQMPWLDTGKDALKQLGRLYGIGTETGAPDYSGFTDSPDYKFALEQGNQALDRRASAAGGLFSGNTLAAAQQYGQGLATQNYGNYVNRLAGLAGVGQTAAQSLGEQGGNTARTNAQLITNAGDARASGTLGVTKAYTDASNQALGWLSRFGVFGGRGGGGGGMSVKGGNYNVPQYP